MGNSIPHKDWKTEKPLIANYHQRCHQILAINGIMQPALPVNRSCKNTPVRNYNNCNTPDGKNEISDSEQMPTDSVYVADTTDAHWFHHSVLYPYDIVTLE